MNSGSFSQINGLQGEQCENQYTAEANCKTFHKAKISVYDDLMGKFSKGKGAVPWLDPCYGIMIPSYHCCPNKELERLEKKTK